MNILAIGAHPDDVEIGCGGFLIKSSKIGHKVYVLCVTRGDFTGLGQVREAEARKCAEDMGAEKIIFLDYRDTELVAEGKLINDIEKVVNEVKPGLVLTHSTTDEHHDHRAVAYSTIEAARYCPNVLCYENPLTKDFKPEVYCDISEVIEQKLGLLSNYRTQEGKMYIKSDAIFGLAQYRALQSRLNVRYCEAYTVVKFKLLDDPFTCQL